ncbi:MAG: CHRD domain-containing protein [Acidimicrobiia bacterium]|nr:CHRD domain-containing protein [Acidimicrobiia bacterium]
MTRKLTVGLLIAAAMWIPGAVGAAETPDEVGFVDPTTGIWNLGGDETFYFGIPGDVPFLGDWDGDGLDTPGLYRPSEGFAYIINRRETDIADQSWFMGDPGDIPIVGDWDGDGTDTFSVYRPSEGKVYISNVNETAFASREYYFGVPQDKPFAIDFNGDGTDDIGLHRESTGLVYMTDATTAGQPDGVAAETDLEFFWGIPNDAVFAGDWNGTGTDSPGLVRPSMSRAYLRFENTLGFADEDWPTEFGDWAPVVGQIPGAPYGFDVELSGSEVVPGPGLPGGSAAVSINVTAGGEVCFTFDIAAVPGVTAAHIHQGPAGSSGPVVVDFGVNGGDSFGCVNTDTAIAVDILNTPENYFVNVHSTAHPAGAVRGQMAEVRSWDLNLVGAEVVGLGDADGFVSVGLELSTSGQLCVSSYNAQRVSTVTSLGLYSGGEGQAGPLVADLTFGPDHLGCVVLTPRSAASIVLASPGNHYLQLNTVQFPAGAVRAQLTSGR